jgi:MurNAc alpha-1-phosphate uridylyltransferase
MATKPDHAFILAAGKGTRLRPYTDTRPKPMVEVAGRPMIDWAIDRLEAAGVTDITINLHYMADVLHAHLKERKSPRLHFSFETELLETGGGICAAKESLGDRPYFVVSGDSLWTDGPDGSALERVAKAWDGDKMDILLLLQPLNAMTLTPGKGDYDIAPDGRAIRSLDKTGTHMWTSIRICSPHIFDGAPQGPFSFLELMDKAERAGRLYALVHDAEWHHITTAEDLDRVNAALAERKRA